MSVSEMLLTSSLQIAYILDGLMPTAASAFSRIGSARAHLLVIYEHLFGP